MRRVTIKKVISGGVKEQDRNLMGKVYKLMAKLKNNKK